MQKRLASESRTHLIPMAVKTLIHTCIPISILSVMLYRFYSWSKYGVNLVNRIIFDVKHLMLCLLCSLFFGVESENVLNTSAGQQLHHVWQKLKS